MSRTSFCASWSAPLNAPAAEAQAPGYPMTYPTAPGYPPQPHYAEHPDASVFTAAPEVPWVPQHAAPAASGNGRRSGSDILSGLVTAVAGLRRRLNSVGHRDPGSVE